MRPTIAVTITPPMPPPTTSLPIAEHAAAHDPSYAVADSTQTKILEEGTTPMPPPTDRRAVGGFSTAGGIYGPESDRSTRKMRMLQTEIGIVNARSRP
jgi:hypothetical protein